MRIDIFLKKTGLIKQRSEAKRACEHGSVTVDGRAAKPGRPVETGERIRITYPHRVLEVEVLALPEGNVRRSERETYFRVVDERVRGWEDG